MTGVCYICINLHQEISKLSSTGAR